MFRHVWRANGPVTKEVLVNIINRKRQIGRPKTQWIDVIAQDKESLKRTRLLTRHITEKIGEVL